MRDTRGIPPNVMLTLEDASAMLFQHLPDDQLKLGAYTVAHPLNIQSARMHPADTAIHAATFAGTIAAVAGTSNWRQKFMRSAQTNWVYYDPQIRYQPWPSATQANGRMPAYPASAAPLDPLNPAVTVNLLLKKSSADANEIWCFRTNTQTNCAKTTTAVSFDPGLYFVLKTSAGQPTDPTVAANYNEYSINTNTSFPKYPNRTDCTGSTCSASQEQQNFSNWFTYGRSRALMVKGAVAQALQGQRNDFRLGWGRINQSTTRMMDGVNTTVIESGVRDFNRTAALSWLYALPANGASPWPQALRAVGEYFKRSDGLGPWADVPGAGGEQLSCRRQHHIALSDGGWSGLVTSVGNIDNSNGPLHTATGRSYQYKPSAPYKDTYTDSLADVAMSYWNKDLRADLPNTVLPTESNPAFWQHQVLHVLGLGMPTTLNPQTDLPALTNGSKTWSTDTVDDFWHATLNARGLFKNSKTAAELTAGLQDMLAQAINTRFETGSAVGLLSSGSRWYVSSANSHAWSGDLQAYALDAQGQTGALLWSAQSRLPAWDQRNIWTWRSDAPAGAVPFAAAHLGVNDLNALGTFTSPAALMDYVRGDRSREGELRIRQAVLGDITSPPLVVGSGPDLGYSALPLSQGGGSYAAYLAQKSQRTIQIVTGGNDGMLHVFSDSAGGLPTDGQESFAYVPRSLFGQLSRLADPAYGSFAAEINSSAHATYHRFYVDGPITATDAFITPPGSSTPQWRNLVLVPLGLGGPGVVALDVTVPGQTRVLWELSGQPELGLTVSPISTGVLPDGRWVAVFGNGSHSANAQATLMVVDLQTGQPQTVVLEANNALGGVGVLRTASAHLSALYAGDAKGQLWRFDVGADSRLSASAVPLFTARGPTGLVQAFTQAPLVLASPRGGVLVIAGTGALHTEADAQSAAVESIYAVWDKPGDSWLRPLQRAQLAPRQLLALSSSAASAASPTGALNLVGAPGSLVSMTGEPVNWSLQRGYVLDLGLIAGLRTLEPLQTLSSQVGWWPLLAPSRLGSVCDVTPALSLGLMVQLQDGVMLSDALADTNGDGLINALDVQVAGIGRRVMSPVLKGERVCATGLCDTALILPATSAGVKLRLREVSQQTGARVIQDRTWRRLVNPPLR